MLSVVCVELTSPSAARNVEIKRNLRYTTFFPTREFLNFLCPLNVISMVAILG